MNINSCKSPIKEDFCWKVIVHSQESQWDTEKDSSPQCDILIFIGFFFPEWLTSMEEFLQLWELGINLRSSLIVRCQCHWTISVLAFLFSLFSIIFACNFQVQYNVNFAQAKRPCGISPMYKQAWKLFYILFTTPIQWEVTNRMPWGNLPMYKWQLILIMQKNSSKWNHWEERRGEREGRMHGDWF